MLGADSECRISWRNLPTPWVQNEVVELLANLFAWETQSDLDPTLLLLSGGGVVDLQAQGRTCRKLVSNLIVEFGQIHRLTARNISGDECLFARSLAGRISHIAMVNDSGIQRSDFKSADPSVVQKQMGQDDVFVRNKPGRRNRVLFEGGDDQVRSANTPWRLFEFRWLRSLLLRTHRPPRG